MIQHLPIGMSLKSIERNRLKQVSAVIFYTFSDNSSAPSSTKRRSGRFTDQDDL